MKIVACSVKNYKVIRNLQMKDIESAAILVGKNNCGKTLILDAIRTALGYVPLEDRCYCDSTQDIRIEITFEITEDDLHRLNQNEKVSSRTNYDLWYEEFVQRLPDYNQETGELSFVFTANPQKDIMYTDINGKENLYIKDVFPNVYYIDVTRDLSAIEEDIFSLQGNSELVDLQDNLCLYDKTKKCNQCFSCMKEILEKPACELNVHETAVLLKYKLYNTNLTAFTERINKYFHKNSSYYQDIKYVVDFDFEQVSRLHTVVVNNERHTEGSMINMGAGMKSIYILCLLEAYIEEEGELPSIVMMEDPEIYLHPQLQKTASEILYRLSNKNQVFFTTHSPNMLFNFSSKQIKQVVLDEECYTEVRENADIDEILDDLGYTANDLMNVSFVFIVEGKQDKNRLPLLLEKYYSEIYDENGNLQRIAIIQTNSCTNIKTYANLKYINKLYIKDQFLMIRDSDGKNPKTLVNQLCNYYGQRAYEDENIMRIKPENVLVLKYYSFENYFLEPSVMAKIGVVKTEEEFYNILYKKFKTYLYKLPSVKKMCRVTGIRIKSKEDIKKNMESIKTYVRGHNLYDIFYGRYKHQEEEILRKYIDVAPKEVFSNITDAIEKFVYFQSRKK